MKSSILSVAVAGSLVAAATVAHADIVLPSAVGGGEVVEFVYDVTSGVSYARGTKVLVNTVLPGTNIQTTANYTGPVQTNYVLPTLNPDAHLTAFLGGAGATTNKSTDTFIWGLQGGLTGMGKAPGSDVYVTTTQTDLSNPVNTPPTTSQVQTNYASFGSMLVTLNGHINTGTAGDGASTPAGQDGIWGVGAVNDSLNWYNVGPVSSSALGQASTLFALTTNGSNVNPAQVYYAGQQVVLTKSGVLEAVAGGGTPVALPESVWMFGGGLLGLFGIGRRRAAAKAASAV